MKHLRTSKIIVSSMTAGAILIGGLAPVQATTSFAGVQAPAASSVAPSQSTPNTSTPTAVPVVPTNSAASGSERPQAIPPIAVRLAVKAALRTLKKVSPKWYKALRAQIKKGEDAFVSWWINDVPSFVKTLFGKIDAENLYRAIMWVFGLNSVPVV